MLNLTLENVAYNNKPFVSDYRERELKVQITSKSGSCDILQHNCTLDRAKINYNRQFDVLNE